LFWGGLLLGAYLGGCVFLRERQSHFIFVPQPDLSTTPAQLNLPYQDVWIAVTPNAKIHGWWLPTPNTTQVLLYLHGNGKNIGANLNRAAAYQRLGFSVLLIDYRGYGRSDGPFPSEHQVYEDAEAAWTYLVQTRRVIPQHIVLYGHSLGGAIAIELATRHPQVAGLIVEGSFTSMYDMANQGIYRLFPINWLLTQRFDSRQKVRLLRSPLLLVHGTADEVVPAWMSQALFTTAAGPKQLVLIPSAGHDNVPKLGGEQYWGAVKTFLHRFIRS
jgi:hypothetical protein